MKKLKDYRNGQGDGPLGGIRMKYKNVTISSDFSGSLSLINGPQELIELILEDCDHFNDGRTLYGNQSWQPDKKNHRPEYFPGIGIFSVYQPGHGGGWRGTHYR